MTDHVPMLSVIMGVYNREKYIAEAIESVLAQTFQDFELIIIDDGSTDSSLDIIRKYEQRDSRIIVIQLEVNSGQSTSRNTGIKKARGQ
ncbi:MAG: glycosyltransferase family 2 protein, partial [Candidatus Andersenbacteria bacterium]